MIANGWESARLLAAIDDLVPELAARAGEIESVRRIPADITDKLRRIGFFRTLLPRSHGGLELSVPEVLLLIEVLAAADGSVGWVAMVGTVSQMFCTRVQRRTFDKIFAQWIVGHCVVYKDGAPVMSGAGPLTRFVVLPAERWRIEDTWHASGLAGSGSHHVVLDDVAVSEAESFDLFHGPSCVPGPFAAAITPFVGFQLPTSD
jgi:alkylation response protein AidB-like acyl-CoA dehydrogenase